MLFVISKEELEFRIGSFPSNYMQNFDYLWKWKIEAESKNATHILDGDLRKETYRRLCIILPRWQTYRNGENLNPLQTLKDSIDSVAEAYSQLRTYTLLDFDEIPSEVLETVWHELGRVKEYEGKRSATGYYYVISVCKPLLLIWGQTLAFDSYVRKHVPVSYSVPKHSSKWNLQQWIEAMREFCEHLKKDQESLDFMRKDAEQRYGRNSVVPYGRYLDIYYWKGP